MDKSKISLIFKALSFASERHRDQRRKDPHKTPYINHPIDVMVNLWELGNIHDAETLAAALLHDSIEDTETSPNEIEKCFGKKVLSLVEEVTDDKSLPKQIRKQLQVENAVNKSAQAKQIKLADKLCNVRDIGKTPPKDWSKVQCLDYLDWAEAVVKGLRGVNEKLELAFDEILTRARQNLN